MPSSRMFPKNRRDLAFPMEAGTAGVTDQTAGVSPGVKLTAQEIEKRFGKPDQVQPGQRRTFASQMGQFPRVTPVRGRRLELRGG